jgi:voltage-gated sodium channel
MLVSKDLFCKIKENRLFQTVVISAIILSALLVGASTYNINENILLFLHFVDVSVTIFFITEIIIRFLAEDKKKDFFNSGWNIFDTLIVFISIIPAGPQSSILLLRLLRIFRVLRLISVLPG